MKSVAVAMIVISIDRDADVQALDPSLAERIEAAKRALNPIRWCGTKIHTGCTIYDADISPQREGAAE